MIEISIGLVLYGALKEIEVSAIIDAAVHREITVEKSVVAVHGWVLATADHGGRPFTRAVELAEDHKIALAQRSGVGAHGGAPTLKKIARDLHGRVHADAVK